MKRCFSSRKTECKGGCKYCFGKWNNYIKFINQEFDQNNIIIYPNCDGDFFDEYFAEEVKKLWEISTKNIIVSISSKFSIEDRHLNILQELNEKLRSSGRGFLKLSMSFSCSDSIEDIEPNTATFAERVETAKRIIAKGIPYLTVIKPILPFISIDEYKQIIDNTVVISPYYVLGDLYVNEESSFYKEYIEGKFTINYRDVSWNNGNGIWEVIESIDLKRQIREYISESGGVALDSDMEAVELLFESFDENG